MIILCYIITMIEQRVTNYLIYAPFPKPLVSENYLENTIYFSKRFYADRASFWSVNLGIGEINYKLIEVEEHLMETEQFLWGFSRNRRALFTIL